MSPGSWPEGAWVPGLGLVLFVVFLFFTCKTGFTQIHKDGCVVFLTLYNRPGRIDHKAASGKKHFHRSRPVRRMSLHSWIIKPDQPLLRLPLVRVMSWSITKATILIRTHNKRLRQRRLFARQHQPVRINI